MSLIYFILLIGILIFIHELGHFLAAKALGVRVLVFSLGFGPRLFGFRSKATDYRVSLLPLGGYVKMLGDDPSEELSEADRRTSFTHKPVWRRLVISVAGPAFNLAFPLVIFFGYALTESEHLPPVTGIIVPGSPADDAHLKPGDRIVAIDGDPIHYWWEVVHLVSDSPERQMTLTVERDGQKLDLTVTPRRAVNYISRELDISEEVGRIDVAPYYLDSRIGIWDTTSPAARAGLKTWDRVVMVNQTPINHFEQLRSALKRSSGASVRITVLREEPLRHPVVAVATAKVMAFEVKPVKLAQHIEALRGRLGSSPLLVGQVRTRLEAALAEAATRYRELGGVFGSDMYLGIVPADMFVHYVEPQSPEMRAGVRAGDRILGVGGKRYPNWPFLAERLKRAPRKAHKLKVVRNGVVFTTTLRLGEDVEKSDLNTERKITRIRMFNHADIVPPKLVESKHRLAFALAKSWRESGRVLRITVISMVRLFQGRISTKEIGGPILIADMAAKTEEKGWGYFFTIMAWISISLGLINLLPIPILDGGHIMFFLIEAIRRKPLSLRVREIASYVGLSLLILLMVLAFKNDIERKWEDIIGFFK